MQTRWILGTALVLGTAAAVTVGCGPDPQGGTGGAGGSTLDGGNLPTSSSSSSSTGSTSSTSSSSSSTGSSSSSSGAPDRCHRTGVVASCDQPASMGNAHTCGEVFDQKEATSLMTGCASAGGQYGTGPCDRTGAAGFCALPDLGGHPGENYYYYNPSLMSIYQSQCTGPLMGTWCPLP